MHHATQQSTPHTQQFSWSVDEHETVSISTFKDRATLGPDLPLGPLHEVLADVGSYCERVDYILPCNPYYTVRNHKKVLVTKERVTCRYITSEAAWMQDEPLPAYETTNYVPSSYSVATRLPDTLMGAGSIRCPAIGQKTDALGALAQSTGLRRLVAEKWTVLAPNGVLHPQFGPAVTAATDGVWVLLLSHPWLPAEWLLVHRSNVIGPVTTTPTALWEWTDAAAPQGSRPLSAAERRAAVLATL